MLPLLLAAALAGPTLGVVFPGGSMDCQPGNTLPPTCLLAFDQRLEGTPFGVVGQVGTGGVNYWCFGVVQNAVANDISYGGSILTDPVRARVSAQCTPFP